MSFRLINAKAEQGRRRRSTAVRVTDRIKLRGGLNIVDSAEGVDPGELLACRNYETHFKTGAYRRIAGSEVFDGQLRPHLAEYWKVDLTGITGGPFQYGEVVGDGVETAIVIEYVIDEEAADDSGYLIISELTNDVDEGATWTGVTSGATATGDSGSLYEGLDDEDLHDAAYLGAENWRRAFITTVGGDTICTGPVKGVHAYNDTIYAFRNLVGDAEGSMWKSTPTGWERITLGFKVRYENGTDQPNLGDTVTGETVARPV